MLMNDRYFRDHNPPHPYYISIGNDSFGANGGVYNRFGRGYPDVAALGDRIAIYADGESEHAASGTSASKCYMVATSHCSQPMNG